MKNVCWQQGFALIFLWTHLGKQFDNHFFPIHKRQEGNNLFNAICQEPAKMSEAVAA